MKKRLIIVSALFCVIALLFTVQPIQKTQTLETHNKLQRITDVVQENYSAGDLLSEENYFEIEPLAIPNDGSWFDQQYALKQNRINAYDAWDITTGSRSVKVGVIDSGIRSHQDLNDNVGAGWNYVDDISNVTDGLDHGTKVAGIIGALGNNDKGVSGVAWNVTMIPMKVTKGKSREADKTAVIKAINDATKKEIDILNISLATTDSTELREAIKAFKGLIICAAGNAGDNLDTNINDRKVYPAYYSNTEEFGNEYSNVISVASTDKDDKFATGVSNYGLKSVQIAAPGMDILSTAKGGIADNTDAYITDSGTSFAAPHVTGVAALIKSKYPGMENALIKKSILEGVDELAVLKDKVSTGGRLNAYKALVKAGQMPYFTFRELDGNAIEIKKAFNMTENITIPSQINEKLVTAIGGNAFSGNTTITQITIPTSVKDINLGAFYNCTSLQTVTFLGTSQLQTIGNVAFAGCTKLSQITIPSSVTSIGDYAFDGCVNLGNMSLPPNLNYIGSNAFSGLNKMSQITIPASVSLIGNNAFPANIRIVLAEGMTQLSSSYLYYQNKISQITIPSSVTYIGSDAFQDVHIILAEGRTLIEEGLLANQSEIYKITIPSSVTAIRSEAFLGCTNLRTITIHENITAIASGAFSNCPNLSITWEYNPTVNMTNFKERLGVVNIPSGITIIPASKFFNCTNLKEVNLPESVKIIEDRAFEDCINLMWINLPANLNYIGNYAFSRCRAIFIQKLPDSITYIGTSAFAFCEKAWNVILPKNLTAIQNGTFAYADVRSIIIPENIEVIGNAAFFNCYNLESVVVERCATVKGNITQINSNIFEAIPREIKIYVPESSYSQYTATSGNGWGVYVSGANRVFPKFSEEGYLKYNFTGTSMTVIGLAPTWTGLTEEKPDIIIPDSVRGYPVTAIGADAFRETDIGRVIIGNNVREIGDRAFYDSKITSVLIPSSLRT